MIGAPIAATVPPDRDCVGNLCGIHALAPYFRALEGRTTLPGAPSVEILQLGDSHSAGDAISGGWRDLLQARYGTAGRGVLPPGSPYWGFLPRQVRVAQTGAWKVEATFGHDAASDGGAVFGMSGYRLTATAAGASFTLSADPQAQFDRVVVCGLTAPGAGAYSVSWPTGSSVVSLEGAEGVDCHAFEAPVLASDVQVRAESAPVTLISWGTFRGGGVSVSNLGVVGAQLRHFARADDIALARELAIYAPDLIVLEFGTNEGFGGRFDAASYESVLRAQIVRLRRLSHETPILVLGAPDAETHRPELRHNASQGDGSAAAGFEAAGWYPPPALEEIRRIQKRVALAEGAAFWDWNAAMGGAGAAVEWAARQPPLMRKDHVHYTAEGGSEVARRLEADLDAADEAIFREP
jgi:lysophospholipase L1-like esterase